MISDGFKARIGKTPITLAMFVDRHGFWAKDWEYCVSVEVQFQDGFATSITPRRLQESPHRSAGPDSPRPLIPAGAVMEPGEIKFATRALGAPSDWDAEKNGECATLPIRDRDGAMQSAWYPTIEEIAMMVAGRPVILTVWGSAHPPVSLHVEE